MSAGCWSKSQIPIDIRVAKKRQIDNDKVMLRGQTPRLHLSGNKLFSNKAQLLFPRDAEDTEGQLCRSESRLSGKALARG